MSDISLHMPDPSNSIHIMSAFWQESINESKNTILGHKCNYSFTAVVKVRYGT